MWFLPNNSFIEPHAAIVRKMPHAVYLLQMPHRSRQPAVGVSWWAFLSLPKHLIKNNRDTSASL
jgi:hypothetical protein